MPIIPGSITPIRDKERLRATEKRALLEVDRERTAAAKLQRELDDATKRGEKREVEHRRSIEALQAQVGDARHQAGVLQGRLDAVQATNVTLQQQLAAQREADTREARPVRAKAAPARPNVPRPAVTRPARTPGPARKVPAASAPPIKTAARRKKRG
jgi:hypothetical protein